MDAGFFYTIYSIGMKRIAIQGTLGSYHDIAAHKYFEGEEIELICCANFEDVFAAIRKDSQTIGMLAIENTIAGSLLHNNELLRQSGTQIIGEYKLRISHSFVCLPEEDWNDITEVNSHPIALMQCREFLNQHPRIKVVEAEDTALSAEITLLNLMTNILSTLLQRPAISKPISRRRVFSSSLAPTSSIDEGHPLAWR